MSRIIYLLLAAVALSGCCFSCGDSESSEKRTFTVGKSRIEVFATSRSHRTNGANRLDWGERVHSLNVRARMDERPEFTIGSLRTQEHMDPSALRSMLDAMEWKLSPNGQHLSLRANQPFPTRFYLLPSGGPAFSAPQVFLPDNSRAALDIAREALTVRSECFKNRDLFRAVSLSADEALQRELLRACGPEQDTAVSTESIDARLASSLAACGVYQPCDSSQFELCLAARSSPCHESAVAYALRRCSPTSCFEIALLKEYATPEEAGRLQGLCEACR
jgi:hypothetical protein